MNSEPLQNDALKAAALWFVQLSADDTTEEDRAAWQAWRRQHPANEYAWQQVEKVTGKFLSPEVSSHVGLATLERPTSPSRRKVMQHLAGVVALGGLSWVGYRHTSWWNAAADYMTHVGEQREVTLPDGSQLTLNTNSAINVRFSITERHVCIRKGEVFVQATEDARQRTFVASTQHGKVTASGTRFAVRCEKRLTHVNLFAGALEIHASNSQRIQSLQAGEATGFNRQLVETPFTSKHSQPLWLNGVLLIDDVPLLNFIADLARYRRGYLIGDANLEGLRISGAFPIRDTDRILDSLALTLPIEVQRLTDYWITITRRD